MLYLIVLIYILNIVYTQTIGGSSCAIMNEKMYITGGTNMNNQNKFTDLITMKLTEKFLVNDFQLKNDKLIDINPLDNNNALINGAIFGEGVNGTKLWMYGGEGNENTPMRYYDLSTKGFNNQVKINSPPNRKSFAWITHSGFFCIFGGRLTKSNKVVNEYWRFNLTDLRWYALPSNDDILPLEYAQGVVLNHQFIVMGGINNDNVRDLSELYIFNIKTNKWSIRSTINGHDYPIVKFTPITYKNYIIIQGGANKLNSTSKDYKLYNDIMVLNTDTWEWRLIELKNEDQTTDNYGRASYSAWLVGNQLVQLLGETNSNTNNSNINQQLQVINLDTFLVAKGYTPPPKTWYAKAFDGDYNDSNGSNNSSLNLPLIIGLSVAGLVLIIIIIAIIIIYKRKTHIITKEMDTKDPFLEPIQPNLRPLWSENDGLPHNIPTSSSSITQQNNSNSVKEASFINDATNMTNSKFSQASKNNHTNLTTSKLSQGSIDPNLKENNNENPLFKLKCDTFIPGIQYQSRINEKFVD